jgi:hypothetical protein
MANAESSTASKAAPDQTNGAGLKEEKRQPKPKKTLPTSRIAVTKQLDILRGYVHASGQEGKPVKLNDLASIMGMHPNTVTLANPFLSDVGMIARGEGGYIPATDVIAYTSAYDWNPEKAAIKLAPTIELTWFAKLLMPKLRMRPMDESEAISELAAEASAGTDYKAQIRMLLEWMEVSGLIARDNGRVTKRNSPSDSPAEKTAVGDSELPSPTPKPSGGTGAIFTSFAQPTEGVVRFNVSVKVDMAEFAGWKPDRIASFFGGIAQVLAAKGALEKDASE